MKVIPSVLNWSYHRQYWDQWDTYLDDYIEKVSKLKEKYKIKEMGIDIGMASGQDAFKSHEESYLLEVRKKLENAGLHPIPIVGTLEIHADAEMVTASIQQMDAVMREAKLLGADVVQYYHNLHGRLSREKAVRVYHEAALNLEEIAEKYNLVCASEEYCGLTGNEIYLAIKDTPRVGLLNDIGNWMILGEDPVAATKKFLSVTRHVHVKDYIFQDGIWTSVPFGEGIIDLKSALDILSDYPDDRTIYAAFETDLDSGDEDQAMDICFRYFTEWEKSKK